MAAGWFSEDYQGESDDEDGDWEASREAGEEDVEDDGDREGEDEDVDADEVEDEDEDEDEERTERTSRRGGGGGDGGSPKEHLCRSRARVPSRDGGGGSDGGGKSSDLLPPSQRRLAQTLSMESGTLPDFRHEVAERVALELINEIMHAEPPLPMPNKQVVLPSPFVSIHLANDPTTTPPTPPTPPVYA